MRLIEAKFGENNYKFGPEKLEKKELLDPYITVLIGPNASGKSRCL